MGQLMLVLLSIVASGVSLPKAAVSVEENNISPPNQVSWQSAFWSLVPIAANSMTQPSGMVLGFPSRMGFFLRTSPVICAVDALYTLWLLGYYTVTLRSLRESALTVAYNRFRDFENEAEQGSLSNFQHDTPARLVIFVLGVLPQVIKLYGIEGLLWTKIWASMFLGSFFMLEILVLVLGHSWRAMAIDAQHTSLQYDEVHPGSLQALGYVNAGLRYDDESARAIGFSLGVAALVASLEVSFYYYAVAVKAAYRLEASLTGVLVAFNLPSMPFWLCVGIEVAEAFDFRVFPWYLFASTVSYSCCTAVSLIQLDKPGATWLMPIYWLGGTVLTVKSVAKYYHSTSSKFERAVDYVSGYSFLLLNLTTALGYYAYEYNPVGTVKPRWTDPLG